VLASLVQRIRARWPHTRIILRGDSGFARDALMDWCESHGIYYLLGLAQNKRLLQGIGKELGDAHLRHLVTAVAARVFTAFDYRTQESWSRARQNRIGSSAIVLLAQGSTKRDRSKCENPTAAVRTSKSRRSGRLFRS
jgi:hypothetical protein